MSIDSDEAPTVGDRVRLLRISNGWTQEDLAAEAAITLSTVQNLENGKTSPRANTIQKLAQAFGADAREFASLHCAVRRPNGSITDRKCTLLNATRDAPAFLDAADVQPLSADEGEAAELVAHMARITSMMNRREIIQGMAATVLAGAATTQAHAAKHAEQLESIQHGLNGRKVGSEVADWARDQIAVFSRLDDRIGGKDLYPAAQSNLNLLQNLLQMRAASGRDEKELRLALAHTASQAGWLAQDAELHDLAAQHYRFGIEMARSVGDKDYAAYCMMRLASQATLRGNPHQCLSQLQAATSEAGDGSPLQSFILNFAVEAEGRVGNYRAAALNLAKAETLFDRRQADRVPRWLYWMRRPTLTGKTPSAFLPFDPGFAIRLSEDALAQAPADFTRDRMVLLMALASGRLAAGEMDEAVARAGEVVDTVLRAPMPRVEKHLSLFYAKLPDDSAARAFKERFTEYRRARYAA